MPLQALFPGPAAPLVRKAEDGERELIVRPRHTGGRRQVSVHVPYPDHIVRSETEDSSGLDLVPDAPELVLIKLITDNVAVRKQHPRLFERQDRHASHFLRADECLRGIFDHSGK